MKQRTQQYWEPQITPRRAKPKGGAPRIDVVTPFSQRDELYLPGSAFSILMQMNVVPTLHLVADGFEPGDIPREIVKRSGGRSRLYRNSESIGPYASVMRVWDRMTTPWYAVQDADDYSCPNRLQDAVYTLSKTGAALFGAAIVQGYDPEDQGEGDRASDSKARFDSQQRPHHFSQSGYVFSLAPFGFALHPTLVCNRQKFEMLNGYADLFTSADCEISTRAMACREAQIAFSTNLHVTRRLRASSLSHVKNFCEDQTEELALRQSLVDRYKEFEVPGVDWKKYGALDKYRATAELTREIAV